MLGFIPVIVLVVLALTVATEVSFRIGRRSRERYDEHMRGNLVTLQAATLGLLALMLGFTMSMAEERFMLRRLIKMDEAAAVSTAHNRALLLPEPERSESRELFRSYVAARQAYYRATQSRVPTETASAWQLQRQLW